MNQAARKRVRTVLLPALRRGDLLTPADQEIVAGAVEAFLRGADARTAGAAKARALRATKKAEQDAADLELMRRYRRKWPIWSTSFEADLKQNIARAGHPAPSDAAVRRFRQALISANRDSQSRALYGSTAAST